MPTREEKRWTHHEENKTMRQARKQIKQNRKVKRVRRKDWVPDSLDDLDALDELDMPQTERIMPKGELDRRRQSLTEILTTLNQAKEHEETGVGADADEHSGIVIEVSSSLCRVQTGDEIVLCGLRGSLSAEDTGFTNVVAVGDQVMISRNGSQRGIIETVLPRRSYLSRPDVFHSHLQQVIVANADQILIVASWRDPALWLELIDRYLITSEQSHLLPVICVNKVDLAQDMESCRDEMRPYLKLGYQVLFTSATRRIGIKELRQVLTGKMTVIAGLSGVGKSSLLTALQPSLRLRVAETSGRLHGGRHTTTQVNLHRLDAGGYIADTPGIREFGLGNLRRGELLQFYPEIAAVSQKCRFANCSHLHEPECAVQLAVAGNEIAATRYQNYQKIYQDLPG